MEFGVHLPLLAFRGQVFSLSRLVDYAEAAEQLGFTTLCANDHLIASALAYHPKKNVVAYP